MTRNNQAKAIKEADNTVAETNSAPQLIPYHFKPGQSGNPSGRPKSARSKLAEITIVRLLADFDAHGVKAIEEVRTKNPSHYLAAIVSLLPKQQEKIESPFTDLTNEELEQLELWLAASRAKQVEQLPVDVAETPAKPPAHTLKDIDT